MGLVAVVSQFTFGSAPALAQTGPAAAEGIQIGGGTLKPKVELDAHHIYNPGRVPLKKDAISDVLFVLRPAANLEYAGSKLKFSLLGNVEYFHYQELAALRTFMWLVGADATYNKDAPIDFGAAVDAVRNADPAQASVTERLQHNLFNGRGNLTLRPGGGALLITASGGFFYDRYDRADANGNATTQYKLLDNQRISPGLKATLKFLPKTAVFAQVDGQFTQYPEGDPKDPASNPATNVVLGQAGLVGSITTRMGIMLMGGYGGIKVGNTATEGSSTGLLELKYELNDTQRLNLGFTRAVQPTSFFGHVVLTKVVTRYSAGLSDRLSANASFEIAQWAFGTPPDGSKRTDLQSGFELRLSYQLADWALVTLANRYDNRDGGDGKGGKYLAPNGQPVGYRYNDVTLRLEARR